MAVFVWGANSYGQLGSGNKVDCHLPNQCVLSDEVVRSLIKVTGGGGHTVWLTNAGQLYSCGWNKNGQLGHSLDSEDVVIPRLVSGLPNRVTELSCGWNHTIAINETGELFVWGSNSFGQLGLAEKKGKYPVPIQLPNEHFDGIKVTEVAAGLRHSVALNESGAVFAWGSGKRGQLGHEQAVDVSTQPMRVMALSGLVCSQVAAGAYHTVAVTDSGHVYCWGCNQFGQCGLAAVIDHRHQTSEDQRKAHTKDTCAVPHRVQPLAPVNTICCGWSHTLAVTMDDRRLYGWGRCDYGQLCTSSDDERDRDRIHEGKFNPVPTEIQCLRGIQQISTGSEHCIAVNSEGSVVTWGWNDHGMCGTGDTINVNSPHTVMAASKGESSTTTLIGAGAGHCIALVQQQILTHPTS